MKKIKRTICLALTLVILVSVILAALALADGRTGRTLPIISAGSGSSFVMQPDKSLWAWGNNDSGQLGDGTTENRYTPITGAPYTPVGGEMPAGNGAVRDANPSTAAVYVDEQPVNLRAYNIGGNNFFMLRDLGEALGFDIDWDAAARTILINTD